MRFPIEMYAEMADMAWMMGLGRDLDQQMAGGVEQREGEMQPDLYHELKKWLSISVY
jgi:hypothetical protein